MLTIDKAKPQRQIPSCKDITANPHYFDLLYAYFQQNCSILSDKTKLIPKKLINFSTIGKDLGLTRQTISKKFQNLKEIGLIEPREGSNGDYILPTLEKDKASLLPQDTLRIMINALSPNSISVYVYLLKRFIANSEKPFEFSLSSIKGFIGIANASKGNNYIITDILAVLKKLGLISYTCEKLRNDDGTIITRYILISMTNYIAE